MIRTFETKKRILFTPKSWCNSVARWILGLRSETGTIRISNTANPTDGRGPSVDIDCSTVASRLEPILSNRFPNLGKTNLIGDGIAWLDGRLSIDKEWIKNFISDSETIISGSGSGTVKTVDGVSPDDDGEVTLNALTDDDIGSEVCSQSDYETLDSYVDTLGESVLSLSDVVDGILEDYVTSSDLSGYATTTALTNGLAGKADSTHTHSNYATTTALTNGLAGKANSTHTHSGYAASNHTHSGYASSSHTHLKADLTNFDANVKALIPACFQSAPSSYTSVPNTNVMFYIPGSGSGSGTVAYASLSNTFAAKDHTHSGYAASNHTHTASDITDFATSVDARITSKLSTYATQSWVSGQLGDYATTSTTDTISGAVSNLVGVVDGILADYVKSSDLNGYATQTWVGQQGYLTNANLSNYATANHTHEGVYAETNHTHASADITDLENTIDGKITTYSNTAAQTYATLTSFNSLDSEVGDISDAVLDLSDAYDTLDADLSTVETWKGTGIASSSVTVVTGVTWTGSALTMTTQALTFANGLLTAVGTASTSTIDTAVLFSIDD